MVDSRGLSPPEVVAPGVRLYHLSDAALLDPPGPVAVQILQLDPAQVRLESVLARDEVMGTETVAGAAGRHRAIAAVNAGFFAPNGDPTGLLQVGGELVSDTARPRGAVAVTADGTGRTALLFDVVSATATVRLQTPAGEASMPVAGVDTTRRRGHLMLFTPSYHAHTDTAARGVEWVIDGSPPTVRARRDDAGSTPIPRGGFVLSYGGLRPPPPLQGMAIGDRIDVERRFVTRHGTTPEAWAAAKHVIGGAGLLAIGGRAIDDWTKEGLAHGFTHQRHPRTLIGVDAAGDIWLVTVDGRNPALSLGMSLPELQRLAARLRLTDALNLDGGGSTTMVVRGVVVNHPSDATGSRPVSDALIVLPLEIDD